MYGEKKIVEKCMVEFGIMHEHLGSELQNTITPTPEPADNTKDAGESNSDDKFSLK